MFMIKRPELLLHPGPCGGTTRDDPLHEGSTTGDDSRMNLHKWRSASSRVVR
jgi:hypothetical protein